MATWITWSDCTNASATGSATGGDYSNYYWVDSGTATYTTPSSTTTDSSVYWITVDEISTNHVQIEAIAAPARRRYGIQERGIAEQERARQLVEETRARNKEAVKKRAKELLVSYLDDQQRQSLEQHGWFIVMGGNSGRRYRIRCDSIAGNIDEMAANDNDVAARLCCHCDNVIPLWDNALAQKIMLESAEEEFLRLANRTRAA